MHLRGNLPAHKPQLETLVFCLQRIAILRVCVLQRIEILKSDFKKGSTKAHVSSVTLVANL